MEVVLRADLESSLDEIRAAPHDHGTLDLIVSRPLEDERDIIAEAELSLENGLEGDDWRARSEAGGSINLDHQITIMNARYIDLISGAKDRWALAGDQLFVDLDLSHDNLPAGSRIAIGGAVLQVSELPHTGCAKFSRRFGPDALRFANSPVGKELRLRGLYARVVTAGTVRVGDDVVKL